MSNIEIYLDNNATTPVDPRVIEALLPVLQQHFGNPSSGHRYGTRAAAHVEQARAHVARAIHARDTEIVFTSGGTEADNAALRGVLAASEHRRHLVISAIEHSAILDLAAVLESEGLRVTRVGVNANGVVRLDELERALTPQTALVSLMLANNETGVVQPVAEAVRLARRHGARVHTDAVQALGKVTIDVEDLGVDLLSLSAHKVYGPKGCGALYVRKGTPFRAVQVGGHQERDRRGGTHNVPGIVGLGKACELLSAADHADEIARLRAARDAFERRLLARIPGAVILGKSAERLPNTTCVCFPGVDGAAALMLLSELGICVSGGAACSSGSLELSHVLEAMGVEAHVGLGQMRISWGRFNSDADGERLLGELPGVIERVAALSA